MNSLELKIPPPLVALCVGLLMWFVSSADVPFEIPLLLRAIAGIVFGIVGFSFGFAGFLSFRRAKTTINPTKPMSSSSLVTTAAYRYTRNPMYLGLLLILLGWGTYLASPVAFLFLPLFMLYINRFQIAPEEHALSSMFGAEFSAYKARVRRWL